jgi:hypothetical protein
MIPGMFGILQERGRPHRSTNRKACGDGGRRTGETGEK